MSGRARSLDVPRQLPVATDSPARVGRGRRGPHRPAPDLRPRRQRPQAGSSSTGGARRTSGRRSRRRSGEQAGRTSIRSAAATSPGKTGSGRAIEPLIRVLPWSSTRNRQSGSQPPQPRLLRNRCQLQSSWSQQCAGTITCSRPPSIESCSGPPGAQPSHDRSLTGRRSPTTFSRPRATGAGALHRRPHHDGLR